MVMQMKHSRKNKVCCLQAPPSTGRDTTQGTAGRQGGPQSRSRSAHAVLALGWVPELNEQFAIVDFPDDFRELLLRVLATDFCLSLILDRLCLFLFGEGKLRVPS